MKAPDGRVGRAFLRFASPFANFRSLPLIGPLLRWASAKVLPRDALTWIQVQHGPARGLWLHLNPRTGRDYFNGDVEREVQDVLQKYLQPGMTFYDVGANIGFFSLLGARLVGAGGRVIAFEADPDIAARLREHTARAEGTPISVEEAAVWSSSDPVFFARADADISPDRGIGHVVGTGGAEAAAGTIPMKTVFLDDYASRVGAPNFIKCDVEGAEVEVIRGATKLLIEKKPIILCEMHGEENRRILLEEFSRFGYICRACGKDHVLALPKQ